MSMTWVLEKEMFSDELSRLASGRVLDVENVSLRSLDYGFYYEDEHLPIVVTSLAEIGREWRIIISNAKPVAASSYEADGRSEADVICPDKVIAFSRDVAEKLDPPDPVYVMDICETDSGLKLLELNPFSGADLYACDRRAIVQAVRSVVG